MQQSLERALSSQLVPLAFLLLAGCNSGSSDAGSSDDFQREFGLSGRALAPTGRNPFFVLEPGHQLVLAGGEDRLTITVLDETRRIGDVTTRVVEEREEEAGELKEVSRNFFAIDPATGDVFYFGEEVDVYEDGKLSGHPGAWIAGENGASAGLIAPGRPAVGMKYYQEIAPGVALDRAEVVDLAATLKTPAGEFRNCLRTHESSGLNKNESEYKLYAEGVGLLQDEDLLLVSHGMRAKR